MEQLQLREKEIFEMLKKIKKRKFVVIGGYAVNAYTLPRFSVDCDIVIKDNDELKNIENNLYYLGYKKVKNASETPYDGKFERYEKELASSFKVSVDILIGEIFDRQTNAKFSAEWVFSNSKIRNLRGKTIEEELKINIINVEALFTMKLISCRSTDIRDLFLLVNLIKDKAWIKKEVSQRYDFKDRLSRLINEIKSKQFKDGLQGVFGLIDEKVFERNKSMILELEK
ncbi:MAG TPA: nucleotidyl transferase AbiEii/AbiGii toxin family protein [Candidatus Nanoarchaeia archaeon]|nr:nucleotidyl transferase AbiEii/AbiGii toxin family protein [Candidatus Nanoarchaeia archaeon]